MIARYHTVAEAAGMYAVAPRTLRRWIERYRIPHLRLPSESLSNIRILLADVDRAMRPRGRAPCMPPDECPALPENPRRRDLAQYLAVSEDLAGTYLNTMRGASYYAVAQWIAEHTQNAVPSDI